MEKSVEPTPTIRSTLTTCKIPHEWYKYRSDSAYFVTYYGEIFFGKLTECPGYDGGFFIIQNDKKSSLDSLTQEQRTPQKYREIGREIRDKNIIRDIRTEHFTREIDFPRIGRWNYQSFKSMFVFGAGASTFCVESTGDLSYSNPYLQCPLGNDVFSEKYTTLMEKYPGAKKTSIKPTAEANVEEMMQDDWDEYKFYLNTEKACEHINIQFYLADLFRRASQEIQAKYKRQNLYNRFLQHIRRIVEQDVKERIALVSFNYDTLLENEVSNVFGYSFEHLGEYHDWSNRNVMVYKPHGSCDWGWPVKSFRKDADGVSFSSYLLEKGIEPWKLFYNYIGTFDDVVPLNTWGYESFNDPYLRGRFTLDKSLIQKIKDDSGVAYFPAILLPFKDKDEFQMPYDHFYAMEDCMEEIEDLYLIGWKGNEDLFNRKLALRAQKLRKIIIVNPHPKEVEENLDKYLKLERYELEHVVSFQDFVNSWFSTNHHGES